MKLSTKILLATAATLITIANGTPLDELHAHIFKEDTRSVEQQVKALGECDTCHLLKDGVAVYTYFFERVGAEDWQDRMLVASEYDSDDELVEEGAYYLATNLVTNLEKELKESKFTLTCVKSE